MIIFQLQARSPKEVATGEVDHNVAPGQGQGDQGEQHHEDEEDGGGGLVLCPE